MLEEFVGSVVCCYGKLLSFGDDERVMEIAGVPTASVFFMAGSFICTKEFAHDIVMLGWRSHLGTWTRTP